MPTIYAIANCRVSSDEQRKNGSLDRQGKSVQQAARELDATLLKVWSGSVSSKKGENVKRTDLDEMLAMCRKNRKIKYVIIDELDRFMRSMLEIGYFLVLFNNLGVKVLFASQPDLKTDTALDTLLLMMEAYKAEGSNEERQRKSIKGQTAALEGGRYTFRPKPGYRKSALPGMHEVHPTRGPALRFILKQLAAGVITPTNALIDLNRSRFTQDHALYKMDKFRKIATDPFYAGIISVNKQVKVTNSSGLHEPLITVQEHKKIVDLFDRRPKNQIGPSMKGNPTFPVSNLISHASCIEEKSKGRLVGLKLSNGKSMKVYEKYRCRTCKKYISQQELHKGVAELFHKYEISHETKSKVVDALDVVWKRDSSRVRQEIRSIRKEVYAIEAKILQNVESAADPENAEIRKDLLSVIKSKKEMVKLKTERIEVLESSLEEDKFKFLSFALDFIEDSSRHFLDRETSKENRIRCKELLFPAGLMLGDENKVYTPEISVFYRLATKKKDTEVSDNSHLVRVQGL